MRARYPPNSAGSSQSLSQKAAMIIAASVSSSQFIRGVRRKLHQEICHSQDVPAHSEEYGRSFCGGDANLSGNHQGRTSASGADSRRSNLPEQLINFMYEEAGEDPHDAIAFISQIHEKISKYNNDKEEEASESHVKAIQYDEPKPASDIPNPGEGGTQEASKIHRSLPTAQQTSPAEGAVTEPAKDAGGDKERVQSMSMVGSG